MQSDVKNTIVVILFSAVIMGFLAANIITHDKELSNSERRKLVQAPVYTFEKLINGEIFEEFDRYSLDQFVFRDTFRAIKAFSEFYIFRKKDNNDIYIVDDSICKLVYPMNENSVLNAARKLNEVYRKYLKGKNVSFSIIPDKNYFVASQNGYLSMDYMKMTEIIKNNVDDIKYIDLFGILEFEDYYNTDIHWSQDRILKVADKLLKEIAGKNSAADHKYIKNKLYPFYGSFYGQAALKLQPDTLTYLTNDIIENAFVYDHQTKEYSKVYVPEKFSGIDPYDVFLSGAKPLITVSNTQCDNNRELILFRDSFGSSIAPLLLPEYSEITLIDLRYIPTDLLGEYIDFTEEQDVLFLYNTQVLNNSAMLR